MSAKRKTEAEVEIEHETKIAESSLTDNGAEAAGIAQLSLKRLFVLAFHKSMGVDQ